MNTPQEIPDVLSTYTRDPSNTQNTPYIAVAKEPSRNTLAIYVDGAIKIVRICSWMIALFATLFVITLATNTYEKATNILKNSLKITCTSSTEKTVIGDTKNVQESSDGVKKNISSNALNTSTQPSVETPEMIAKKRAALIEARKTARLQQEKLKAAETQIQ